MGPDQAGAKLAILERLESAAQQGAAGATSHKDRIDIQRIDLTFEAQAAVARAAQAAQSQRAEICVLGHQHGGAMPVHGLDGGLPARGMRL